MLIRHSDDVTAIPMNMQGAADVRMKLLCGREHGAPTFAMRQFQVAPGGHTPLHAHNYEHEVFILQGTAELPVCESGPDGKPVPSAGKGHSVHAGDVVFIPANQIHQFRNTGSDELKFICLVPVQFDCGQGVYQSTPGS